MKVLTLILGITLISLGAFDLTATWLSWGYESRRASLGHLAYGAGAWLAGILLLIAAVFA